MNFDLAIFWESFPFILEGLVISLYAGATGTALAVVLAVMIVWARRSPYKLLGKLVTVYTEIILGIPVLVLIFLAFYMLPLAGLVIPPLWCGVLALGIYYSPYMAEVFRSGINAVAPGQQEAGIVIGMSRIAIMRRVVIPQALPLIIPPLTGLLIGLLKDTALLSVISVAEMTFQAKVAVGITYAPFEVYALVALIYWFVSNALAVIMRGVELRATRYKTTF